MWHFIFTAGGARENGSEYDIQVTTWVTNMGSRSFGQFQAALNGIVGRHNPRARRNMAVRQLPGGGMEFDTIEEMIAYQRAVGGAAAPSAPPPGARPARPAPAPTASRTTARQPIVVSQGPITYAQADIIGKSIGGVDAYCPQLKGIYIQGGTHVHALTALGVDRVCASRAISRMEREGVKFNYADLKLPQSVRVAKQAQARKILEEECRVSCPMAARIKPPGVPNPRRNPRRR